jgi:hypothetical protein
MTTRIRKGFKGVASIAAAGLLTVVGMTSANATGLQAPWLGQMQVTAPVVQAAKAAIANLGAMTVTATRQATNTVANLGSMTVTAKATDARVVQRSKPVTSTGESDDARARAPRAVLVQ